MIRKNKAGKEIVVEMTNPNAWMNGREAVYESHCFGCRRSSKPMSQVSAHEWADKHMTSCSID
ncbi:hypothetical protein [Streptomyces chattanoogensis]|uniref:hypothetical protein n=1 Tax=Streptomyces chattanoogensis TaxID=66876 RepID=UPI0036BD96AC